MKNHRLLAVTLIAAAVLAGCGSLPANNSNLDQARSAYSDAQANSQVTSLAAGELKQASDSLDKANNAWSKGENSAMVDHLAYVAKQQVNIAQATARQKTAEMAVANARNLIFCEYIRDQYYKRCGLTKCDTLQKYSAIWLSKEG